MSDINRTITSLPEKNTVEQFKLRTTSSDEIVKIIKSLRKDCWTGYDNIPVLLKKPEAEHICSVTNAHKPETPADYRPISVLPILSKVY